MLFIVLVYDGPEDCIKQQCMPSIVQDNRYRSSAKFLLQDAATMHT